MKKVEAFVSSEKSEAVISALESSSYQATFYESRGIGKGEKQELSFRGRSMKMRYSTRSTIVTIVEEFIQDLNATAHQVLQNISFGDIAKVVGPANPGNPWATTNTYLETITQQCTKEMSDKWQSRLGGVDIFMDDNCVAMLKSLRLD